MNLISLFFLSVFANNIVLFKFLGLCPFMGTSCNSKKALQMGLAVIIVITLSSILIYFLNYLVLVPTNTTYLLTIVAILVIASMVQVLEIVLKSKFNSIYQSMGLYLPLITTNCAVLGVALLNITNQFNFLETIIYSIGSGLGFIIVIYIFSTLRERLDENISKCFQGIPIAMIMAGIMTAIVSMYI